MRQAIVTKYLGPTNFRGARVKATAQAGSVTIGWDHALDVNENHECAMRALMAKFDWDWPMVGGALPSGGNAYVCADDYVDRPTGQATQRWQEKP